MISPGKLSPRPAQVTVACLIGMASQVVVLATLPLTLPVTLDQWTAALPESSPTALRALILGIDIAMAALYGLLLVLILRGRNGPRWAFIGLVFGFAILEFPAAFEISRSGYGAGVISLSSTVLDIAAAVLLLQRKAVEWFKAIAGAREGSGN